MGGMVGLYSESDFMSIINKEGRWTMDELKEKVPAELIKDFKSTTMKAMEEQNK